MPAFADRLATAVREKDSCLVVGLDPFLDRLPLQILEAAGETDDPRANAALAIERFNAGVIEAVAPFAAAVKPQVAFYEMFGPAGIAAYERTLGLAHDAGLLVIGDIKRGDIGSTASAYARAHLDPMPGVPAADAVTVNPYLGRDSIAPFLEAAGKRDAGVFVLVRTSNPSAVELQELSGHGRPLYEDVAALVDEWGRDLVGESGFSSVGAVVGATAPEALMRLRSLMPKTWFLIPGVGAQGGAARDVAPAFAHNGLGALVNSSRGILYAYGDPATSAWQDAVANAAKTLRDELREAAAHAPA